MRRLPTPIVTILNNAYRIGLVIKGLDGLIEFVGGIILLLVSRDTIHGVIGSLTRGELSENPHSFIINSLNSLDSRLTHGIQIFAALYLIGYGLVKMGLAVALLKRLYGAYRPAIIILSAFLIYQIYQIGYTHSKLLIGLTTLDAIVLALVIWEYRRSKRIAD
jgi:uncharacterized membrane protein